MSLRGHYTRMRFGPRRGHYTRMRFGPQVALPHRFARSIHRIYSKWSNHCRAQVHPSGEAIPYFQPSPPGTCATLGFRVLQRHRFIVGPACRPESVFREAVTPPRRVLASISSTALLPMRHQHAQWEPGFKRGALPREHWRPDQRPPVNGPHTLVVASTFQGRPQLWREHPGGFRS